MGAVRLSQPPQRTPQRKADDWFRWTTTMVHGDDNSSLPQMTIVSRCPWCLGILVLFGLVTLSGLLEHETAFAKSPVPTGFPRLPQMLRLFASTVYRRALRFGKCRLLNGFRHCRRLVGTVRWPSFRFAK